MKYLGINYVGGILASGIYDSAKNSFTLKRHADIDRVMGFLYYGWYGKSPNRLNFHLLRYYTHYLISKLVAKIGDVDVVVLSSRSGSPPFLANTSYLCHKFANKKIIHSDHFWGHINAVKYHPKFQYPSLVVDSSAMHSIIAYIPDSKNIEILSESQYSFKGTYIGLGKLTVHSWADLLQERVFWPGQPEKGKENIYKLYARRGQKGRIAFRLKKHIERSPEPLCEDVIRDIFPKKMSALRDRYHSLEEYRNDWVAGQQQLLRDIFSFVKTREARKRPIKTFFVSGGISCNPAFQNCKGWLRVPDLLAGDDGAGCFMAYLGYHVNEQGLKIDHSRWRQFKYVY